MTEDKPEAIDKKVKRRFKRSVERLYAGKGKADDPFVSSYADVLEDMIDTFIGKTDYNDTTPGSVIVTTLEAMAKVEYDTRAAILDILIPRKDDDSK